MWGLLVAGAVVVAVGAGLAWWVVSGQQQARERAAADTVEAYASAWEDGSWNALAARVRPPAEPAVAGHRALVEDLEPETLRVEPVALVVDGDTARAELEVAVTLADLDPWSWAVPLRLVRDDDAWQVVWAPDAVHPEFVDGGGFRRGRTVDPRAAILDRDGRPLAGGGETVAVGIEPRRVTDDAEVVNALTEHAGASRSAVEALLARDDLVDDWFYPVVELPRPAFDEVEGALRPVPGVLFRPGAGRAGPTGGFALHLLGRVEELSAAEAEELGHGYEAGDSAGAFGLERARDRELAGVPAQTISIVGPDGAPVADVHETAGVAPADVQTSLDRGLQQAAEAALDDAGGPAAVVAVDVGSMEVRAAASRPLAGFNRAFEGRYPPGSTFKVVTTAALLDTGLDAESSLDCPATRNVGGRSFRNAGDRALGTITLRVAFAESCNTAYVGVMPGAEGPLATAAAAFGFDGTAHDVALDAFGGSFPEPEELVEAAAAAIGQGRVEASPLHMATVAAAAVRGEWQAATLFPDSAAAREPRPVPGDAATMRDLMAEVVASGTGTAAQLDGAPVLGKTGTAEFGSATPPDTHAWFIGVRDELAFAVLVEGGGSGGEVAAPLAARFLRALE
jgi:cell division protein FtsI/penicillin-binding protein 2